MLTTEPEIIEAYVRSGRVKLVFRDVLNHDWRSVQASEAAACAGLQERFWHMHRIAFEEMSALWAARSEAAIVTALRGMAGKIDGLDLAAWDACMNSDETLARLNASDAEQRSRGITVQPVFEIVGGSEGLRMFGDQGLKRFGEAIEAIAAKLDPALLKN